MTLSAPLTRRLPWLIDLATYNPYATSNSR